MSSLSAAFVSAEAFGIMRGVSRFCVRTGTKKSTQARQVRSVGKPARAGTKHVSSYVVFGRRQVQYCLWWHHVFNVGIQLPVSSTFVAVGFAQQRRVVHLHDLMKHVPSTVWRVQDGYTLCSVHRLGKHEHRTGDFFAFCQTFVDDVITRQVVRNLNRTTQDADPSHACL